MAKKHYDILVVGNGVVGLSVACTLKMLSFDVAIISAFEDGLKEKQNTSERNLTIVESSRRFLDTIGVWKILRNSNIGKCRYDIVAYNAVIRNSSPNYLRNALITSFRLPHYLAALYPD